MDDDNILNGSDVLVKDDSQVQEKVRVKRNVGSLKRIKVILEDNDLSISEIFELLEYSGIKKSTLQSMLSQYVKKGILVKTDKGYKVKKDDIL